MGKTTGSEVTKESRRELRRRQLRILAHAGLVSLAVATAIVTVMALQR
ncbi:hypothetical protein [Arthrobacter sp. ZGTC131]|nr:hypothetical protein [Arthrobacter sp. ZGTC131]